MGLTGPGGSPGLIASTTVQQVGAESRVQVESRHPDQVRQVRAILHLLDPAEIQQSCSNGCSLDVPIDLVEGSRIESGSLQTEV